MEKYLPRNIWSMVDLDYLCPLVLNQCIAVQNLKSDDKMSLSLGIVCVQVFRKYFSSKNNCFIIFHNSEILSKWPMFGSSFFQAKVSC